jgi:hypothetical protein
VKRSVILTAAPGATPLLDEWRLEIGDDAVMADVAKARRIIADGTTPGFSDTENLRHGGVQRTLVL